MTAEIRDPQKTQKAQKTQKTESGSLNGRKA